MRVRVSGRVCVRVQLAGRKGRKQRQLRVCRCAGVRALRVCRCAGVRALRVCAHGPSGAPYGGRRCGCVRP